MMTPVTPLELVGLLFSGAILLFSLGWVTGKRIGNYSIVDALWSLSFGLFALLTILLSQGGYPVRKFLFGGMFVIWSLRLGIFLTVRIFSHLEKEDIRYQDMRKEFGKKTDFRFFLFYMAQAISVVLLLAPLLLSAENPATSISPLEVIGAAIWFIGLVGEGIADAQKSSFRAKKENEGKICKDGLWRYSRHPNYFFEALVWAGYGTFVLATPGGWVALYAPLLMLFLLLKVTGVPPSEKLGIRAYGDAFREYQKETSVFIPLPVRKPKA